jgi:glutamyl-tRNA reductase
MAMAVPVAVVGMDFREGPSTIRARLKGLDDGPDSPSARLVRDGYCEGIVRVESCSRVEWIVSASNPSWAAELLRGSLLKSAGVLAGERKMHVKTSTGALHYLVRMALGLESVAEGEHAIGRQVLRAFELAHESQRTDRVLHLCWTAIGRVLQARKATGVGSSVGVQSLVVAELAGLPRHATVLVKGQGEIGRQVLASLHREGFGQARGFTRAEAERFFPLAQTAEAVVVCTGGPAPWLELPPRSDAPLAIDIGAPAQVKAAPGWTLHALDEVLTRRGLMLGADALRTLETLCDEASDALREAIEGASQHHVLEALESEKRKFFDGDVDQVLAELSPKEAKRVSEALRGFTHRLLEVTRRAGRVS